MKKSATKHTHHTKFNPTKFFTDNIGALGLIVVILFFAIYMMLQKMNNLEKKVLNMELNNSTTTSTTEINATE